MRGRDGHIPAGSMFGRYQVVDLIGRGAMGAVYEAVHLELEKHVALKTLHPNLVNNAGVLARFVREGKAASRIRHPSVVDVSDVGVQDGVPFLVMELLSGEDLSQLLARSGTLSPEQTVEFMLPVLGAVHAAHAQGVVHRDLKPANIFLARVGDGSVVPKVLDFGISKVVEPDGAGDLTATEAMLGTPYYMSPEQARSSRDVDSRSDQFSLGVILYECVTGRKPFKGESLLSTLKAIDEGRCLPLWDLRPDLPQRFTVAVMRAMSTAPEARFPSVAALADELKALSMPAARGSWVPAAPPPSSAGLPLASTQVAQALPQDSLASSTRPLPAPAAPRGRLGILVALVAVLAIAGGAAAFLWDNRAALGPSARAPAPVAAHAVPAVAPPVAPMAPPTPPVAELPAAPAMVAALPTPPAPVEAPAAPVVAAIDPPTPAPRAEPTPRSAGNRTRARRPRAAAPQGTFMPLVH